MAIDNKNNFLKSQEPGLFAPVEGQDKVNSSFVIQQANPINNIPDEISGGIFGSEESQELSIFSLPEGDSKALQLQQDISDFASNDGIDKIEEIQKRIAQISDPKKQAELQVDFNRKQQLSFSLPQGNFSNVLYNNIKTAEADTYEMIPTETITTLAKSGDLLKKFGFTSDKRMQYFLAQISHESAGFTAKGLEEQGPRSYFNRYEGRKSLGNIQPGDGYKFRGRGYIQLTGRWNYKHYGNMIGVDLENNPDLAANPQVAILVAAAYIKYNKLHRYADKGDFNTYTKRINGGFNGLKDRQNRLSKYSKLKFF